MTQNTRRNVATVAVPNANAAQQVSPEIAALMAQVQALQAEVAKAKQAKQARLSLKVSAKGGVSLYGMGRWPVTLYRSQWETLLGMAEEIKAFIQENEGQLSSKNKDE